ncbi:addiction module protein [Paraglaciecola sp. MB-3u-78]|uniref:addiction module protein n=1 Tax=Paraglaciecola sp. MB-3u-78 TaxID=2058332 RepID=UPI000C327C44|nr:addiction module protein [Paraglaciecola sp. MB-3u-78]PKH00241.1 addiction module protein [Paraglaciecola sp. MB-3u-78]
MKIDELSPSEKMILAQQLWDSVAVEQNAIELMTAQKTELNSRLSQFESDQNIGLDWNTVKSKILDS